MSLPPPNLPPPPPLPRPQGILAKLKSPKLWIPVLCVLAFVLVVLLAWWLSGSWLAALVTALAIALIVLVVVLLRVVFTQDREDRIERGIPDPQRHAQQQALQQPGAADLDGAFRRGVADLQGSKMGSDFYSLPWLLVVGESGAGKSDAMQLSGLDVPPEFAHLRSSGPTRDITFWFTNQAILLDTAGRFVESEDPSVTEEWRRLLQLLRANRPGTPLDGLIVAISVDSLIGRSPQELADRAHTLRRRINELTDQLRVDVPIYVMVTKADHIEGFVETTQSLPPDRLHEAFGWTNDRRHFADAGELVAEAFDEVVDQLEHLLPEMMLREAEPTRRRRLFLFPQELRAASDAIGAFLRSAFAPSVYGEVPFLRGVYFTSAKREGRTISPLLQGLGHEWAQAQVDSGGPAHGLFLLDVFREVALGDRDLAVPANWMGRRFRRFATISTAAVALLVMLMIGWSFVDNLLSVRRLTTESRLVVDGASDLVALEKLRAAIVETGPPGDAIQRVPLGGFGLGGNLDRAARRARETFTWAFGSEYESPTKNRLVGKVAEHGPDSFEALATLALDVTWLATRAPEEGSARPDLVPYAPIGRNEADMAAFSAGYDSYVQWLAEPTLRSRVESERDAVNAAASRLLDLPRLEQWAARTRTPVRYQDFGIAAPDALSASTDEVHPAYTREVWNSLVSDLVAGVQTTGGVSASQVDKFRQSYVQRFDKEWRDFLIGTPTAPKARGRRKDSPYLALVERIDQETRTELPREGTPLPSWVALLQEVRRTESASEEEPLAPWQRYEVQLDQVDVDVEAATEQGIQALDLTRRLKDSEGTSFASALDLVRELVRGDRDSMASRRLREVLSMPILDGSADVMRAALEELDQRWRDNIASPYSGSLDSLDALYRPDGGALEKFSSENGLESFYADGRALPVVGDATLAFGNGWLAWMQHAEEMQSALYPGMGQLPEISVRLEGIPARKESGSGVVARRDLRLACRGSEPTFRYNEGSGSFTFPWTPRCQELSLRIWVREGGTERELRPRKEWGPDPLAFPNWLQSAQRLPDDVLRWRMAYDGTELLVDYRLRSGRSILDIAHRAPTNSMRD